MSAGNWQHNPLLVVQLKPGWRFDMDRSLFLSATGERFSPQEALPKPCKLVEMVPALSQRPPALLSKDEQNLARYLQIVLPKRSKVSRYLAIVEQWKCVQKVYLSPTIGLPHAQTTSG